MFLIFSTWFLEIRRENESTFRLEISQIFHEVSNNTVENTRRHIRETCTSRCNDNGNRRAQLRLMSDGSRCALYNASASVAQLLVLAPDFTPVRYF